MKLEMSIYVLSNVQWMILIPIYLILSPLCMISSSLFDWIMSYIIDDQTFTLIMILILQWAISALLILQLIFDRAGQTIFFHEFVFFLTCSNCILIGVTYSLLQRTSMIEQLFAKICTSLFLILLAEKLKQKYKTKSQELCVICFNRIDDESIYLKCKHVYHEGCLWDWVYVKQECPTCRKQI